MQFRYWRFICFYDASRSVIYGCRVLTGYLRVILAACALYYMPYHPRYCTLLYGASSLLDAADGYAARKLNQTSQFGAVLDMIVDRCVFIRPVSEIWYSSPVDALLAVYYAISLLHILTTHCSSKLSSVSTFQAITCTWSGRSILYRYFSIADIVQHFDHRFTTP